MAIMTVLTKGLSGGKQGLFKNRPEILIEAIPAKQAKGVARKVPPESALTTVVITESLAVNR